MVKRFGGWTKQTRKEHWEHIQELRDNQKNGPITTNNTNPSTQEQKNLPQKKSFTNTKKHF